MEGRFWIGLRVVMCLAVVTQGMELASYIDSSGLLVLSEADLWHVLVYF